MSEWSAKQIFAAMDRLRFAQMKKMARPEEIERFVFEMSPETFAHMAIDPLVRQLLAFEARPHEPRYCGIRIMCEHMMLDGQVRLTRPAKVFGIERVQPAPTSRTQP